MRTNMKLEDIILHIISRTAEKFGGDLSLLDESDFEDITKDVMPTLEDKFEKAWMYEDLE